MKNAKYFIWATAVVVVIGGLALYWSMTHEIEYALETAPADKTNITGTVEEETRENKNEDPLKVAQAGAVDLAVEFTSAIEETADKWVFKVAMNTHSVNLEGINLYEAISFVDGNGNLIDEGFDIKTTGAGHHLTHYVLLPKDLDGQAFLSKKSEVISMIFKNIDGIEETQITWNVQGLENLFHEKETN